MNLHNLTNTPGASKRRKRLGCGQGSGRGKTSGRGVKGYKARSGSGVRPGFEGGQMPLYRKLPHRGFSRARFRQEFAVVNVGQLDKVDATEITHDALVKAGLIRKSEKLVKVLGQGEISKAVTITADAFSATAIEKIEKAGGKVIAPVRVEDPASEEGNA